VWQAIIFQFLEPEVKTVARWRVISHQNSEIQQEYMNRIRIEDMKLDKINQIACNIVHLSLDIEEESNFRRKIAEFIAQKRDQKVRARREQY
jgi:hypothetical protein